MASVNRVVRQKTHEGAPASHISARAELQRSVMSCLLWENGFYESGQTIADRIASLVPKVNAAEVAEIAIQAKRDMRLRHVPLLLAVELAKTKEGRAELKRVLPVVLHRPDDLTELLALYWRAGKRPIAKQIKRHLGLALLKFDEYRLGKYNGGSKAVKLVDVLRLTRPKPESEDKAALLGRLRRGELATPDTWEVELSKGGDKKEAWERLLREEKLGGLAMLRNIRNMTGASVDAGLITQGISRIKAGLLLPINFIAAARTNPQFEPAIEQKFLECFAGKEQDRTPTTILIDVSGSMDAKLSVRSELLRSDVAAALAMIGRELFSDLRIFTFSDQLVEVPARRGFALRDAILQSQMHSGTHLGHAVRNVADTRRLIVITDEQSHDPVPQMRGYMINVASDKNGVGYGQWLHIDGWSDKVLDYILRFEKAQ